MTAGNPPAELVDRAADDFSGFDPARSYVVGDRWIDIAVGNAIGGRSILVRSGAGKEQEADPQPGVTADAVLDNLAAAASWILEQR